MNESGKAPLLHQALELRAAAEPEAVALVAGEERITCGELDARANRLARLLRRLGVGPEVRVAICAERTAEMVVAMYAVLKAGGAYVPVDPAYPEERQAIILEDSGALFLLTQERLVGRIPRTAAQPIFLDRDWQRSEQESAGPLAPLADESNLAYVIYTSGSTGRPKGVAIAHRSAVAFIRWAARVYLREELSGVLAATSICFDLSIFELFVAPALGGRAILAEHALSLPGLPAAREVTLVNTVPSAIAELARSGELPPSVRTINLAGEALRGALVERLYATGTVQKVYNAYGPSEDTTYSTWALIAPGDPRPPAIGRPIDGTWGYLLDGGLGRVPPGTPGELYLGGEGLARGYLGRPDLTAARFVPDLFSVRPGERIYATGDLVRCRQDGGFEYLGRIDHQVKIRGFRVELGEIEAELERHPGVGDTVVVALEFEAGGEAVDKVLVGYVVPRAGTALSVADLQEHLRKRLAEYMVPTHFVVLEALPLNPNGKVDRAALPKPEHAGERPGFVAPRTPLEVALAEIWSEVLRVPAVGIADHFFELGGHSLLAARAIARIHDVLGHRLPPRALFGAPTVERLAALLTDPAQGEEPDAIPARRGSRLTISTNQEALWFTGLQSPGMPLFTIPLLIELEGPLDGRALLESLAEIVRRHEALRVLFRDVNGRPEPVLSSLVVDLPRIDLGALSESARSREADAAAAALARRCIDLERGPLMQCYLMELDERSHRLLITLHHIAGDDWSTWVLTRDLAALYSAAAAGWPADLPALKLQFSDYAAWQEGWLEGEEARAQLAFWKRHLLPLPEMLDLPTDRPRSAATGFRGGQVVAEISRQDARALQGLALRSGATVFMAVLAALDALLHRCSGQSALTVGALAANRHRPGTQELIGLFTNTLVCRADLAANPRFDELLRQVRETLLGGLDHQGFPFDLLVRELQPKRSLGHMVLTQVFLSFQNTPPLPRQLGPGLDLRLHELGNGTAKADITLYLRQQGEALFTVWEYSSELFDVPTIVRMSRHFQSLLSAAIADSARRISDLPLLAPAEVHQLLTEWNDGRTCYPREACIHDLVGEWVGRTPDAVAVVFEESRLTYRELDSRAELLAGRLRALGVGPEVFVAVAMERSLDLVVAFLAILKAGGAFVPIDPGYPRERIAWLLADSGALVRITETRFLDRLPGDGARTVLLGSGWEREPGAAPSAGARMRPSAENLVYMMYTSGTTGVPKGVAVSHRGAVRLVRNNHYARLEGEVFLHLSAMSFDASVLEIWGALANGARLVLFPGSRPSLEEIGAAVERYGVTTLWLTAGLFQEMVENNLEGLRPLRQLLTGGDVVSAPHARTVLERLPGCTVIDGYGPTENSTFTTCQALTDPSWIGTSIPIGRPIANTSVHLLDRGLRPVPCGVPGELLAGGDGLARGYHRRPDLTAEKFIPDPVGRELGARLYRTGDLALRLPDGRIDLLGRIDQQVKIRGFRVELGEIEAILTGHPAVAQAAAAVSGGAADRRLLAYLVPAPGMAPPAVPVLRDHLRERLPEYMIPSAWVFLDALPLSANGKVDRRALPEPEAARPEPAAPAAPLTPTQEVLAGIWVEVLKLPSVGAHEDFFDLGGHSLLATQVISRVRRAFKVELPLRCIFEHSTVASFASAVEAALGAGGALEAPGIERAPRTGPLPLSFSQTRLWILDQLLPGSAAYNISVTLDIVGAFDIRLLHRALAEVVRRHEALRTVFPSVDGEPRQMIEPAGRFPLPVIDLGGLAEGARSRETVDLIRSQSQRPFALDKGPLFRGAVLKLGRERHSLLLAMHHIVSDGWSLEILLRELMTLYEAFAAGLPSPLHELPVQYGDFAVWQRRWLAGEALSRQLDYWRRQLADVPAGLDLPTDFPRPVIRTYKGAVREAEIPAEMSAGLRAFCRREGVTLYMLLLSGFAVLLSRYSGQEDVLVGSPIANRNRAETEGLIGFFVNTLVLRANLAAASSFRDVLQVVRESSLAAYGHQDLPFETLVEELRPERDLSRSPFFQVLLSVNVAGQKLPSAVGLELALSGNSVESAKFDLSLDVVDSGAALWMGMEHSTDLFWGATVQRLLGHLERLLEVVPVHPERDWRDLPLLTDGEQEQLLAELNDTGSTSGAEPDICLHRLFEAQAERFPERVALVAPEGRLTYRELNDRADRLARRLRAQGLGPEAVAGVLMDRTADLVVALLAVLKGGGAYAPLDPRYPRQRVLLMLETSGARVLIAHRWLAEALGDGLPQGVRIVFFDPGLEEQPPEERESAAAVLPDNLAYVFFTSGSTGVPKGVAIQHRNALGLVRWAGTMYSPEEFQGVLASTSICFDLSVFEIFATLGQGGKVILAENALALPDLGAAGEVVLLNTVPSAMAELLRLGSLPPGIQTVNLAGEPLKGSLVREIHEKLPGVERVINLYGPSEDTTYSTGAVIPRGAGHPLIGRPLKGRSAYVLDAGMQPAPLGIPGALHLGGEGVTRGYLNRPDLTAERYIPNPFGPPGSRLYRTGDLARILPTGELDFLGRMDHQVKIRGFRIELGEVEAALGRLPEVRGAVVLAATGALGDDRLVAYVETEQDLLAGELRSFLKQSLPSYMVPSAFVLLRELPLTPNGKIDRRALAGMPLQPESAAVEEGRAPRDYVEEVLAGIWSEIFGHPVKADDSFFELGGHSLMATRVVSRIRLALKVELPLQQIFSAPTLQGLSAVVEKALAAQRAVPLPPISRVSSEGELVLSFAQQRLWFLGQIEQETAMFSLPAPLRLIASLDVATLSRAIDEIARRHDSLHTRFGEREGRGYQEVLPESPVPLPQIDLSGLSASRAEVEAEMWASVEARQPWDLARGPLFRAALLRLGAEDWVLLVDMHHIVTDGWSMNVFARELRVLYDAFVAGLPSPLAELPLQYPDFAVWQRQALSGEAVQALVEDWKRRFGTDMPALRLPTDRPRPPVLNQRGAFRSSQLSPELTRDVQKLAQRSGATLFMTLLAAFQALLHRYSGQERIVVGSPVACRDRPELEDVIGFFVNTLVLPCDLSSGLTFRQILERSREMALGAYSCQDLPFEKLVEALQPVRDKSRSPLFQVMFLLRQEAGSPQASAGSGGRLRIEPFGFATGYSQFDLTLFAAETPDGLLVGVEYKTGLFDAATMDRLLEHYRGLLAAVTADPGIRLEDLPVPPLTKASQAVPATSSAEPNPEPPSKMWRDHIASRRSKLTAAQREALDRRLKDSS